MKIRPTISAVFFALRFFVLFGFVSDSRAGGVLTWGSIAAPPATVQSNIVALAGGQFSSIALKSDGTVVGWGSDCCGQTDPPAGLTNAVKITAGEAHSAALRSDGTVVAWGNNNGGACDVPVGLSNVVALAAGGVGFNLALKADGTIVAWGDNSWGECNVPGYVTNAVAVAAGYSCGLAILSDGTVTGWGDNEFGQLNVPTDLTNAVAITGAERHVAALKSDGTVVAWGNNSWGQCNVPAGMGNVTNLVAGGLANFAVTSSGQVFAWGSNNSGESTLPPGINSVSALGAGVWFGEAVVDYENAAPILLQQLSNISVYVGDTTNFSAAAVGAGPMVWQWYYGNAIVPGATNSSLAFSNLTTAQSGNYFVVVSNNFGSLTSAVAHLTVTDSKPIISGQPTSQGVYPGGRATFLVVANGSKPLSYQWRFNGTPIPDATNSVLTLTNIASTNLGNYLVLVSNLTGTTLSSNAVLGFLNVVTWGSTNFSGLGNIPADLTNAITIAAGSGHSVALKSNGRVVVWGDNYWGQTNVPLNLSNVAAIAAGLNHTVALKSNSTVVAWGTGGMNVPAGLTNVIAIAAGDYHNLALKTNGTVVAWGEGGYFGTATNVPADLTNVIAIAAGNAFSAALKSNGTVVVWGSFISTNGMTNVVAISASEFPLVALRANGTVVATSLTTPPAGMTNVVAIAAGRYHALALKSDGTVTNWALSPVTPAGLSNVLMIASGQNHCLAIVATAPPRMSIPLTANQWKTNGFSFSVPGQPGKVYALEYKNALSNANWLTLRLVAGTGGTLTLTDNSATNSQRFYRVRQW